MNNGYLLPFIYSFDRIVGVCFICIGLWMNILLFINIKCNNAINYYFGKIGNIYSTIFSRIW